MWTQKKKKGKPLLEKNNIEGNYYVCLNSVVVYTHTYLLSKKKGGFTILV